MGASKTLYLMMSEEEYLSVPQAVRSEYLADKIYRESDPDIEELLTDEEYSEMYNKKKELTKSLDKRKYYLREQKRKNNE